MIVVEGPDGSGKTTLAKWIADEYDLDYRRAPTLSSTTGPDEEAATWFESQLSGDTGEGGVYDRVFVVSELLYQLATPGRQLMRSETQMTDSLMRFMNQVKLLIFCLPPWPVAKQNLYDHGRLQLKGVDENQLRKIHWAYEYICNLFKESLFEQVTLYDYTVMSKDHIKEAMDELVGATG